MGSFWVVSVAYLVQQLASPGEPSAAEEVRAPVLSSRSIRHARSRACGVPLTAVAVAVHADASARVTSSK